MFNGIWLVATEPLTIKGRTVQAGEQFHISRIHSGALLVTGKATMVQPQPSSKSRAPEPPPIVVAPKRRGRPKKTEPTAPTAPTEPVAPTEITEPPPSLPDAEPIEPPPEPDTPDEAEVATRRYHRRDLEAEP